MLYVWKRTPLLRLLLPFGTGILLCMRFKFPMVIIFWALIFFVICLGIIQFRKKKIAFQLRHLPVLIFTVVFLLFGMLLTELADPRISEHYFSKHFSQGMTVRVCIDEAPDAKEKSMKMIVSVLSVSNDSSLKVVNGKLLLYIRSDSSSRSLQVDDEILINCDINEVGKRRNPFEFDYANYLANHKIYYQAFADSGEWILGDRPARHSFRGMFIACREYLLEILHKQNIEEREFAVLSALVLGKTTDIDMELMSAYAATGAIHVLAVSGLHVGLIYVLLSPLMRRIFPKNKFKVVKSIVPILVLWIYAGLTGFSPSVMRASLMFTFFIIADNFQKQNNIFNTMSASALLLLVINPCMILELGFQLSYLAVLGIVVLQKKIASFVYVKQKVLLWAWQLTSVSLAAQIATFPVSVYYFHQFPNYFLLSNFIVIPLSTLILYISLGFFALSWNATIGNFIAHVSALLTRIMNDVMVWMHELPYSLTKDIVVGGYEAIFISGLLISLCYWMLWHVPRTIYAVMFFAITLITSVSLRKNAELHQEEICFHSLKGHTCITHILGQSVTVYADEECIADEKSHKFHLNSYWSQLGSKQNTFITLDSIADAEGGDPRVMYLQCGDKRILQIDSISVRMLNEFPSDFYLFNDESKNVFLNIEQLDCLSEGVVLFGDGFSKKKKSFITTQLKENTQCFDLSNGAVIYCNGQTARFEHFY